jgi:hypothetical protein
VKIYVAMKALRKRERQDETQIYHKENMVFVSFKPSPSLNVNGFFLLEAFFLESHPMYDQTQCSGAVFSLLYK